MNSFSAFWWLENAISAESWNTWCNFWRVKKPSDHMYMASSSSFTAFWKPDSFYLASCEHFDGLKFLSMPIRENHGSRVPRTEWAHFRFFGGLKTPFLPRCVTHESRDRSFFWAHFRHLGAPKCCKITLYHGFHDFAKKAFSSCQNAKN